MTKMTKNRVSTTAAPGQEQFENFTRKVGRQVKRYVQYDYRHTDGELFSCVRPTLDACALRVTHGWVRKRGRWHERH